jgi:hypothetical protein
MHQSTVETKISLVSIFIYLNKTTLRLFINTKVFVISRKNNPKIAYALKIIPPDGNSWREFEVGKLAKDCPFLLETKAVFASEVFRLSLICLKLRFHTVITFTPPADFVYFKSIF